jgi:hypothetical protein
MKDGANLPPADIPSQSWRRVDEIAMNGTGDSAPQRRGGDHRMPCGARLLRDAAFAEIPGISPAEKVALLIRSDFSRHLNRFALFTR